jgi:hypothetical protein
MNNEIKAEQARVAPLLRAKQQEHKTKCMQDEEKRKQMQKMEDEERATAKNRWKIAEVLHVLKELKMTVPEFLDAFWNSKDQQYAATVSRHLAYHAP